MNSFSNRTLLPSTTVRSTTLAILSTLLLAGAAQARHTARLDGTLHVSNERAGPVQVRVDGDRIGAVPARSKVAFAGIPNGVRLVEIEGRGPDDAREIAVPVRGTAHVRFEPLFGAVDVRNDARIAMRVTVDGRNVGTVAPGRTLEADRLRPGSHTVVARPVDARYATGDALNRAVDVRPGRDAAVKISPWLASVTVTNPFRQPVELRVDGRAAQQMRPGLRQTLTTLTPGLHTFELVSRGRVIADQRLRLAPGARQAWQPQDRRVGDIRVSNDGRGPVQVLLDGRCVEDSLGARQSFVIRDVALGTHTVTLVTRGRPIAHRVTVQPFDDTTVVARDAAPGPRDGRRAPSDRDDDHYARR